MPAVPVSTMPINLLVRLVCLSNAMTMYTEDANLLVKELYIFSPLIEMLSTVMNHSPGLMTGAVTRSPSYLDTIRPPIVASPSSSLSDLGGEIKSEFRCINFILHDECLEPIGDSAIGLGCIVHTNEGIVRTRICHFTNFVDNKEREVIGSHSSNGEVVGIHWAPITFPGFINYASGLVEVLTAKVVSSIGSSIIMLI